MRRLAARRLVTWPLLALSGCGADPIPDRPPNLVVIVVDTLRADHVGSTGGKAETPNLDLLAQDGVVFPLAFSHAPLTLPAHAALFSARSPEETGVLRNGQRIRKDLPLLADWLREHGYASQAVVSLATLWPTGVNRGLDRGFRLFQQGPESVSRGSDVVRQLEQQLEELSDRQPFFLFAHLSDPHEPYDAHGGVRRAAQILLDGQVLGTHRTSDSSWVEHPLDLAPGAHRIELRSPHPFVIRSLACEGEKGALPLEFETGGLLAPLETAVARLVNPEDVARACTLRAWIHDVPQQSELAERYRREVQYSDRCVGRLLWMLQRRGLYADSLVVFTSDHGEALGERGVVGHGMHLHDELLHVPLIVKPPAGAPSREWLAEAREVLVRHQDLVPTVLELLGLEPLPGQEGVSLGTPASRLLFAETHPPQAPRSLYAIRDERTKLIYDPARERFELYDLESDPLELRDRFAELGEEHRPWQEALRQRAARRATRELEASPDRDHVDAGVAERMRALGY